MLGTAAAAPRAPPPPPAAAAAARLRGARRGAAAAPRASAVDGLAAAVRLGPDGATVRGAVSTYYGETLATSDDLRTTACCTAGAPPPAVREALRLVPQEVKAKYYGCGSPFADGMVGSGARVLDLGCGSGRDCFVAAALVGERGAVLGVDMTPAQLAVGAAHAEAYCREALGYAAPNLRFAAGEIEDLAAAGVADASVDLIISNCVVNLSADKGAVLREAYRALAPGGEMYFSDVYADRRLPAAVRADEVMLGECLGGALYVEDFLR
jgi:arsenite methyltransferase